MLDFDDLWVFTEAFDEAGNALAHGGGEKQRLSLRWQGAEQLGHFIFETHVEHAVRLVEDGHFDVRGIEAATAEVIEQAAWGSDDDLSAIAEGAELAVHGSAAIDWGGVEAAHFCAEAVDFLTDLHGKFAGWAKDENLRVECLDVDFCQSGQGESGGFSGTGGGEADEIFAFECRRNAECLNRRWPFVTEGFDGGEQGIGQTEF